MNRLLGVILIGLGTAGLWFGGVPYKSNETVLKLGAFEAKAELDKVAEIPKPVAGTSIAIGTVLLLIPGRRKK